MGGGSGSGSTIVTVSSSYKALLCSLAVGGFIWLLLVGSLDNRECKTSATGPAALPRENSKQAELVGGEKLFHPGLDLNDMSKRKVPNGPDPIHNRRTGNSGRPPGQARP